MNVVERVVLAVVVVLSIVGAALTAALPERSKAAHLVYDRF